MAKKSAPSKAHKAAMQRGRELSRAVDNYLKAVGAPKRRGRPISARELTKKIDAAKKQAATTTGVTRLKALQTLRDLKARQADLASGAPSAAELARLEAAFVKVAARYTESHGIEYQTWREAGVPAATLKKAGVS